MQKKTSNSALLQFNLAILKQEHRENGPASKGYKKLAAAIKAGKDDFLFDILRHHDDGEVYLKKELDFRYETDYLIKFYSLLQIAMIAGYIPPKLPEDLRQEIIMILGNPAVKKYYSKHYPLLLPQLILKVAIKNKRQVVSGEASIFRELLLLDYKEDDEVEAFLFLLDGFNYSGKGINEFNKLLSSKNTIKALLKSPRKDETLFEKAFWGFIKHNDYMQQYESLLQKCDKEMFRSAVWHYRGYWFKNMKTLMRDKYAEGIYNIKELADSTSADAYKRNFSIGMPKKRTEEETFDYKKNYVRWKRDYKEQVAASLKSISYNLNNKHSKALKEYFSSM